MSASASPEITRAGRINKLAVAAVVLAMAALCIGYAIATLALVTSLAYIPALF